MIFLLVFLDLTLFRRRLLRNRQEHKVSHENGSDIIFYKSLSQSSLVFIHFPQPISPIPQHHRGPSPGADWCPGSLRQGRRAAAGRGVRVLLDGAGAPGSTETFGMAVDLVEAS